MKIGQRGLTTIVIVGIVVAVVAVAGIAVVVMGGGPSSSTTTPTTTTTTTPTSTFETLRCVGDFEDSTDYWVDNDGTRMGTTYMAPYHGNATRGEWSLKVGTTESSAWSGCIMLHIANPGTPIRSPMADNPGLVSAMLEDVAVMANVHVDVTVKASEWVFDNEGPGWDEGAQTYDGVASTGGWVKVISDFVLQDDKNSWQQYTVPDVQCKWNPGMGDRTFSIDIPISLQGTATWAKLIFYPMYNDVVTAGYFYFDSVLFQSG